MAHHVPTFKYSFMGAFKYTFINYIQNIASLKKHFCSPTRRVILDLYLVDFFYSPYEPIAVNYGIKKNRPVFQIKTLSSN